MPAFSEPVQWAVRFGPHATHYGQPYRGMVAVKELESGLCEVIGLTVRISRAEHEDITRELARLGYRQAIVRRIKIDGRQIIRPYQL